MTPNQAAYAAVAARRSLPYGQRPTDLHIRVMFLLARWQDAEPPHARLAKAAHCHRNSVGNALRRLRDLGLLSWTRQFTRLRGGWLAQIANRYSFDPVTPVLPMHNTCWPRKEPREKKEGSLLTNKARAGSAAMREAAARPPDLLAARRAALEARWRGLATR